MGRPNPRHGKGRGRLRTSPKFIKRHRKKPKSLTELIVKPWFPEDEKED